MKTVLIVGATSAIAMACSKIWAKRGCHLILLARDPERLSRVAADLRVLGAADITTMVLDINDLASQASIIDSVFTGQRTIDISLIATGTLPEQGECEQNPEEALRHFQTNALSVIAFLTRFVSNLSKQQMGAIGVITSVAGDRGRPSNFYYGSAKAAVSVFLSGLRAKLYSRGLTVTDIKPGFVDTPMTANLKLPALLVVSPERVATDIVRAIEQGRAVCYTPGFWRWIMLVIKNIPEFIFKRLAL